jgi:hypothetical protein
MELTKDSVEQRALAFSLGDLEEACGGPYGEWGTLAEDEVVALLGHFCLLMPTQTHLPAVALEYCRSIGEGNLRKFAAGLRQGSVPQPEKLAPVWWRQRAENRISTEEFHYNFILSVQDYDWLTSLVDELIGYMADDSASNAEALLNLRMVSRELAKRREQALRVSSGEDHREFSLLLTPEYFGTLRRLAAMQSDNQEPTRTSGRSGSASARPSRPPRRRRSIRPAPSPSRPQGGS